MNPAEALTDALSALYERLATEERVSFTQAVAEFGGGAEGTSRLAESMAGTTDRGSREYKSQRRTVERYLKGERGETGAATRGTKRRPAVTLRRSGRGVAERRLRERGSVLDYEGEVRVSDDTRDRAISGVAIRAKGFVDDDGELRPGWDTILDHMDAGDAEGAAALLMDAWRDGYDLPRGHWTDVDKIDVRL